MLTDEFITTMAKKRARWSRWPWLAILCLILFPVTALISPFLTLLWPIISIALVMFIWDKDRNRKTTFLEYSESLRTDPAFIRFCEAFAVIMRSRKIWRVISSTDVKDRKRNAGASQAIVRWSARFFFGLPKYVASNINIPIVVGSKMLCFFPDAILIVEGRTYRRVGYSEMKIDSGTTRFIESGFYPKDAPVIDHTWQFVNKNGGADKRLKNNRRFPVLRYDTLDIIFPELINDEFYVSLEHSCDAFADAFDALRDHLIQSNVQDQSLSAHIPADTALLGDKY